MKKRIQTVKISDLILWQWRPSLCNEDIGAIQYFYRDELRVRELMQDIRKNGMKTPIFVNRRVAGNRLSPKGRRMLKRGKLFVWNGFHRIYAARRLGYKTIRVEFFD